MGWLGVPDQRRRPPGVVAQHSLATHGENPARLDPVRVITCCKTLVLPLLLPLAGRVSGRGPAADY